MKNHVHTKHVHECYSSFVCNFWKKNWKQLLTGEWLHQCWYTDAVDHCSTIKISEWVIGKTACGNLQTIKLSENIQFQKVTWCMITFIEHSSMTKLKKLEELVVAGIKEEMGQRRIGYDYKNVIWWILVMTEMLCILTPLV